MGAAYTPGLTVTRGAIVRKLRRLPLAGEVLVTLGAKVGAGDVVARTQLPGKVSLVNLATGLGVFPDELQPLLAVDIGGTVAKGQVLARARGLLARWFGRWFETVVASPIDGVLESVSAVTGMAVMREAAAPVEITAYIDGTIVEVIAGEGVIVETRGALVQGIFGLGGERRAELAIGCATRDRVLDASDLTVAHRGKVVIGGGRATLAAIRRAIELEVAAVVCGGFAYQDVRELLGYDVGVAVTGDEPIATTLIVTEGFGEIAMAAATHELLVSLEGKLASVNGATQIRAGVIRPEVIVAGDETLVAAEHRGLELGAPVRCIRAPYFGRIGVVKTLPIELAELATETSARVVVVALEGEDVVVPRANVEVIER